MNKFNIVGGVFYTPALKVKDIYGEEINFPSLYSYVHNSVPVKQKPSGYQPRFQQHQFSAPATRPEQDTSIQQSTTVAPVSLIIPTIQTNEPVQSAAVDIQTTKSYSSNEDAGNKAGKQYGASLGIKDARAYAYLLGQIKHESGDFKYMEGLNTGEEYEGRKDLGNTKLGDGVKYKERGPIQVTGRANYEKIYRDFFVPNGLEEYDIVNNPELAKDPYIGSLLSIGGLATTSNGRRAIESANKYDVIGATYAINGGYNGLNDRIKRTNDLLKEIV